MANKPSVLQVVGYSNSGKTTLLTKLIPLLEQEGLRVGVIKHDGGHDFEWDRPGKDTWRYRDAGASLVAIVSRSKTAMLELKPVPLPVLVERMAEAGADLVLVEGFKQEDYEKLVVLRDPAHRELVEAVTRPVAVASWEPFAHPTLPVYAIDDAAGVARFILNRYIMKER
ncbi:MULTISPECIES: molybdopterin-guanine dinucleotide biosynthesis protein B [Brevibacillus]|jgi:molybdopterin-guanine dinucleotide biosynthesis adapter protein|uniref:molybdopterin-guanine dinucleotide biosynthesis protein B n=1 Tax=Brevibacillus TaxID=55080 RepID=UPI000E38AF03|nr:MULTISPECIES: molybdopterin-guanine dinucleotide biosynthesis protein B [Bacillales]MDT3417938.1 molybdopterin-guanine dinucleotide biosynthesis protein B [Brevibacillus aydinogluensis]REK61996.1 MAG: molybdopterin-guanine dinucleotide biosynthesis protein B [Brevibacillus sp.]UFJ59614.1 molybdopterin-guanine dinucleotide biosynthesis protein B [Anoxybacillus sediminis]